MKRPRNDRHPFRHVAGGLLAALLCSWFSTLQAAPPVPTHSPAARRPSAHPSAAHHLPASRPGVPHYVILGRAVQGDRHGKGRGYAPGHVTEVRRAPYAYGWFGAAPRRHWVRHEGFRRNMVQWRTR